MGHKPKTFQSRAKAPSFSTATPKRAAIQTKPAFKPTATGLPASGSGFDFSKMRVYPSGVPIQRAAPEEELQMKADTSAAIQRAAPEEELQAKADPSAAIQREAAPEEDELQKKADPAIQRAAPEEELQAKADPSAIQREAAPEEELQAKADPAIQREAAPEEELQAKTEVATPAQQRPDVPVASGGGDKMPPTVQRKMEAAFGQDFSDVRVHQGPEAKAVGALAYTRGTDLHFQPGQYNPHTIAGQELLGHELTHVIQQREGRVQAPQGKGAPINADRSLEAEADTLGAKAARWEMARPGGQNAGVQMKPADASYGSLFHNVLQQAMRKG